MRLAEGQQLGPYAFEAREVYEHHPGVDRNGLAAHGFVAIQHGRVSIGGEWPQRPPNGSSGDGPDEEHVDVRVQDHLLTHAPALKQVFVLAHGHRNVKAQVGAEVSALMIAQLPEVRPEVFLKIQPGQ